MFWNQIKRIFGISLSIAKAEFKVKNEGTWLGILWYLISPLVTFLFLLGIFQNRLGTNIPNYPLYLLLGIVMFNYFQKIGDLCVRIVRTNAWLIRSMNFPTEALVISSIINSIFSHFFEVIILIIFLLFFKIPIIALLFYPLILIFLSIFALGFGLILASLGAYFFDLNNIWGYVSKLIWFATPIFYAIGTSTYLFYLNLFNPLFYFITIARDLIIYNRIPELWMMLVTIFYCLFFLLLGLILFNKLKIKFAEIV